MGVKCESKISEDILKLQPPWTKISPLLFDLNHEIFFFKEPLYESADRISINGISVNNLPFTDNIDLWQLINRVIRFSSTYNSVVIRIFPGYSACEQDFQVM